jgi:hypothetical protein
MKKIAYAILILALGIAACEQYDSLPEPELPVRYIEFDQAVYNAGENSICLTLHEPFAYDDELYATYNKMLHFYLPDYIKSGARDVDHQTMNGTTFTLYLRRDARLPPKLVFDTRQPCYLSETYNFDTIIVAKAYIKTAELPVTGASAP